MTRRTRARLPAVLLAAALLAGCGLPLQEGVQSPGRVAPDAVERGEIEVLPPGPRPDAGPREVVLGFLGAQTSDDDDHALAREFLAPEVRSEWDTGGRVLVYDPASVELAQPEGSSEQVVTVRSQAVAAIEADGGWLLEEGTQEDVYRLAPDATGQLRLVDVPSGLRLTPAGAARTFSPAAVYFLAPQDRATPVERVVPDRVFLPADGGPQALVEQLLSGPTSALGAAVATAVPAETALRRPVEVRDGVLTVDLTGPLGDLPPERRRGLSAQLAWTLLPAVPAASALRLLHDGEAFDVPDVPEEQELDDWSAYDPSGTSTRTGALYVEDRRLQRLGAPLTRSEATDGRIAVDAAVASPSDGRLALLTDGAEGAPDVVRTGPLPGPFDVALTVPQVRSLSWGSGERGLWVVTADAPDGEPRVLLVRGAAGAAPAVVSYASPARGGPLSALRVSRDGARVAAVFGQGVDRRLYVGRVEPDDSGLRISGLRLVAPDLGDVADVAWESGTSLVALAPLGTPNRLPVRVAVDGSEVEPVRTLGLDGEPETVAAAPGAPLVVGAVLAGAPVLLLEEGGLFRLQAGGGRAPAYPG